MPLRTVQSGKMMKTFQKSWTGVDFRDENMAVASPPIRAFALSICIVLLKFIEITQGSFLISSEATRRFFKTNQKLFANVAKGLLKNFNGYF